jgi:hypothetical protein
MNHLLCKLWRKNEGQDMAEYAAILAVILACAGGRYDSLGGKRCEQRVFECSQLNSVTCGALITATGLQLGSGRLRGLGSGCSRKLATHSWFRCSNCLRELSQPSVVRHGEPMQRFEELCDLIVIERDVEKFSTLVMELNQLDPTRRLPVISKQPVCEGRGVL